MLVTSLEKLGIKNDSFLQLKTCNIFYQPLSVQKCTTTSYSEFASIKYKISFLIVVSQQQHAQKQQKNREY